MSLAMRLPPPVQTVDQPRRAAAPTTSSASFQIVTQSAPPYGQRKGWVPRRDADFGDGGAFPEIHMAQYPLGMGKPGSSSNAQPGQGNALAIQTDSEGKIRYDQLVRQGHAKDRIIYSKLSDIMPKSMDEFDLSKPTEEEKKDTTEKTREALQRLVEQKVAASAPVRRAEQQAPFQYIRHTPAQGGSQFNSGAKQRIIRLVEAQKDPMEPPRFKINKKIPRGPPSPPAPVVHSPTRKVSAKEQQDWKIPACISNWKNPRGYTIALDKRVAADGRGLQQVHINENFSKLAESLYIADRKAREAVEMRSQMEKRMAQLEKEKKEDQLRKIAQQAKEAAAGITRRDQPFSSASNSKVPDADDEAQEREDLRRERAKDRARQRNLARASGDTKARVQRERDISEQIALGMPSQLNQSGPEGQFDQRLFNQTRGLDSGFAGGEDDLYNIYDKPWRSEKEAAKQIYRPSKAKDDEQLRGPVAFEKEDPFNLNMFFEQAKKSEKRPAGSSDDHGGKRDRRE